MKKRIIILVVVFGLLSAGCFWSKSGHDNLYHAFKNGEGPVFPNGADNLGDAWDRARKQGF